MRKTFPNTDAIAALLARPDFLSALPQQQRLYEAIKREIIAQRLLSGEKLPSTRSFATEFGIARNTVIAAFEQLAIEGFVVTQTGSGTYVSGTLATDAILDPSAAPKAKSDTLAIPTRNTPKLSDRGLRLTRHGTGDRYEIQPFTPGDDDFSVFPYKVWQRYLNRAWRQSWHELLDYSKAGGYLPLRRAIADYLRASRSVNVSIDQIVITSGTQQSLKLCAQLLTDIGDSAWVENPCYWGASRVFEACGLGLRPIAVDDEGMAPSETDLRTHPRIIYLTPSHQYPLGSVMSLQRRRTLLDFAAQEEAWILEDDYDSEFRYSGRPLAALKGLDTNNRVIYMGTFSKIMYPGIKIGYIVIPETLAEPFKNALYDLYRPGQVMVQASLAEFIEHGHFATHIRKIRAAYGAKRAELKKILTTPGRHNIRISPEESGLHLVIELPDEVDDVAVAALAAESDLDVRPLSIYYLQPPVRKGLLVGYAYAAPEKLGYYGKLLAHVIHAVTH